MQNSTDSRLSSRKLKDRSIVLLLIGAFLLMPPIVGISYVDEKVGGVPVTLIYIFLVWALLILGAAILAGPLQRSDNKIAADSDDNGTGV